jgi:ribosomal protein S18 acetylase RimI-like enzyme
VTQLRTATRDDVPALLALWEVAAENDARPTDSAEKVETLLVRDPDACLVAELDGRVVGSLIAGWDGWRAHLYRLAVHPDARRLGIGTALLAEAEKRLIALGATRIDAMVLEANELGQSIWRASGYQAQDEWRRWIRPLG